MSFGEPRASGAFGHEYWLRRCDGFCVYALTGRLGVVEDVVYGADPDRPTHLVVAGERYALSRVLVPVEAVDHIEPLAETVLLKGTAGSTATNGDVPLEAA